MKLYHYIILFVSAITLFSCRSAQTKSADYHNAYIATVNAIEKKKMADNDLNADELKAMEEAKYPKFQIINGEKVRVKKVFAKKSDHQPDTEFNKYNVVVAQFRQYFNANSLAQRLSAKNTEGEAFVIETSDPTYFVVYFSSDDIDLAVKRLREAEADGEIPLKEPYPIIITRADI